jgi:phage RecT family recombinase
MRCSRGSLVTSVLEASDLSLSLSRSSGEAYLIPRKDKAGVLHCHFQAGYQGLVKLARESGQVNYVHARVVYQHDEFDWGWTPELEFIHRVDRSGRRGAITHVYAVARLTSGELVGECMTVEEVQQIRLRSGRPNEGPWVTDWEEMAKKTVARKLCKWLPKTPKLIRAIESHDADWEFGVPATPAINDDGATLIQTVASPPASAIAASSPAPAVVEQPTKANRLTAQLAARAAALAGLKAPLPPSPPGERVGVRGPTAAAAAPTEPQTAAELAAEAGRLGTPFFATYGRSRRFPVPMTSWSKAQVKQAWDAYLYERDVVHTEPAASVR